MKFSEHQCFKAVSFHDGKYFALGMGKARAIELPANKWLRDSAKYGISAARSASGARAVIKFARQRKKRPVPSNMLVVKALGRGIVFRNKWRAVFRCIMIMPLTDKPRN